MVPRRTAPAFNPQRLPDPDKQTRRGGIDTDAGFDQLQLKSDRHNLRYADVFYSCIDQA
jgi:hypothetical protein